MSKTLSVILCLLLSQSLFARTAKVCGDILHEEYESYMKMQFANPADIPYKIEDGKVIYNKSSLYVKNYSNQNNKIEIDYQVVNQFNEARKEKVIFKTDQSGKLVSAWNTFTNMETTLDGECQIQRKILKGPKDVITFDRDLCIAVLTATRDEGDLQKCTDMMSRIGAAVTRRAGQIKDTKAIIPYPVTNSQVAMNDAFKLVSECQKVVTREIDVMKANRNDRAAKAVPATTAPAANPTGVQ